MACPRSADHDPTKQCACDRWQASVGHSTRVTITAAGVREARKKRAEAKLAHEKRSVRLRPEDPQKLNDLAKAWLNRIEADGQSPVTIENRAYEWRHWVAPYLGGVSIAAMTTRDVLHWWQSLRDEGVPLRTCHKARECLEATCDHAIVLEIRADNPVRSANIRKSRSARSEAAKKKKKKPQVLTPEQVTYVIEHGARSTKHKALIYALAHLGVRKGEVLGLKWSDFGLQDGSYIDRPARSR